jgi:rubrerythrin
MAFFEDLSKKAKDMAFVASEKAKDVASVASEKAQAATSLAKINMAIAGEEREIEKNYRTIGEWFVSEYTGEIPEAVKSLVDAVAVSKEKIAALEAEKPKKEESASQESQPAAKVCPICGAESDSKFCPQCGAPMGE